MPDLFPTNPSMDQVSDTLTRICAETRAAVAERQSNQPLAVMKALAAAAIKKDRPRGFGQALKSALIGGRCGLIAEFKRRSPSGGAIREGAEPADIARAYQDGGAVCLSVLTEGPNFGGSLADLKAARAAVDLPILRKDFILDPWQIYESRANGADCILLIMAALTDAEARALEETARSVDLDVLVEVHDERELDRALGMQTPLIGINNRNLRTLHTDVETTVTLATHVPPDRILVAESGISTHEDLRRVAAVGAHCLLVGESLLRQPNIESATRALLGAAPCGSS